MILQVRFPHFRFGSDRRNQTEAMEKTHRDSHHTDAVQTEYDSVTFLPSPCTRQRRAYCN